MQPSAKLISLNVGFGLLLVVLLSAPYVDQSDDKMVVNDPKTGAVLVLGRSTLPDKRPFFGLRVSHENRTIALGFSLNGNEEQGLFAFDAQGKPLMRLGRSGEDLGLWIQRAVGGEPGCFFGRKGEEAALVEMGSESYGIRLITSAKKRKSRIELRQGKVKVGIHASDETSGFFLTESEVLRVFSGWGNKGYLCGLYGKGGTSNPLVGLGYDPLSQQHGLLLWDDAVPAKRFFLGKEAGEVRIRAYAKNGVDVLRDFLK